MSKQMFTTGVATLGAVLLIAAAAGAETPAPIGGAPIPPEAQSLIEAHVAWQGGWAAIDGLRDITLEGTIAVAGLSGPLTVQQRRDGFARVEYDLKVLSGVECVGGDVAWERNASGQIEEMGRDKADAQRRGLARTFGRHLHGEGVTVSAPGSEQKDGRTWSVLRFAYPNGDSHDLLVDPASGEVLWSREIEDGRDSWTRLSDFRTVGGLRLPFNQETLHEHAMENQTVTWQRATVNTGLGDELFARPGEGARVVRIASGATLTEWMPMELHFARYIYLRGKVNGRETDIVLDSGAGITVLDKPVAEALHLQTAGSLPATGTGGTMEASLVEGITLELGGLVVGPLTAAVLDLADVNRRIQRDLSVILGKELFHAMVVDIDYPNSRIRFHDPAAFKYDGPGHRLELLPAQDGHKDVMLSVEGLPPAAFGLDTGDGGALALFRHYTDEHALMEGRPISERKGGGVGGATISKVGTLRTVAIAGYELRDVPVSYHRADVRGAFDTQRLAGNLGAGVLVRFRVLFDYPSGCLWLEPGPELDAPFPKDKSGLSFTWEDGALQVYFVAPGSPAAAAGWQEGERVSALDGEPAGPDWWRTAMRWARQSAGTTVRLTMADGSARTLVLRDYH